LVLEQIKQSDLGVAGLALEAAEESDFLRGDHCARVVRNLAEVLARGADLLPAEGLLNALL
jgi:hypothetical protein